MHSFADLSDMKPVDKSGERWGELWGNGCGFLAGWGWALLCLGVSTAVRAVGSEFYQIMA